jgi:hypothetical protein
MERGKEERFFKTQNMTIFLCSDFGVRLLVQPVHQLGDQKMSSPWLLAL